MVDLTIPGVIMAVTAGLAIALYRFWRAGKWEEGFLLFFLPLLLFFLWHFSVEAYTWGDVWANAPVASLGLATAVALIDIKVLITVFLLIFWLFVWKSTET